MSTRDRRRQLLLSTATLLGALTGYGNRAYAACTLDTLPPGTSTYHCSDSAAVNTTTQNINHDDAEVITNLGFGVDTTLAGGNAITITGDGALSYTDDHMSPLTAAVTGLYIKSTGDSGANYGSITVNTGGDISGGARGIYTRNDGSGFIDITTTGDVTGDTSNGIHAVNDDANGTDITVNTGAGTVYGGNNGIYALNKGQGFVEVTANGNVTGNSTGVSGGIGILAQNLDPDSTHVTVTTGSGTVHGGNRGISASKAGTGDLTVKTGTGTVEGGDYGIHARNLGQGSVVVTANGDVTGNDRDGIRAYNGSNGSNITVTTGPGTVSGGGNGIGAYNKGTGSVMIDVQGTSVTAGTVIPGDGISADNSAAGTYVTVKTGSGTIKGSRSGIYARKSGTGDLTVTTGAGTVTGGVYGIDARNKGQGSVVIETGAGMVTGNSVDGIFAYNTRFVAVGDNVTVTTGTGAVQGQRNGIRADNWGTGFIDIATTGDVTSNASAAIYALNSGANSTDITVKTGPGTVQGSTRGIDARNFGQGSIKITTGGGVTGNADEGIYARSVNAGDIGITVASTGTVTSLGPHGDDFAVASTGASTTLIVSGTLKGGGGGAVEFDQTNAYNDRLELRPGFQITTNGAAGAKNTVLAGDGTDTLAFGGTGEDTFDLGDIDDGTNTKQFRSFETFRVESGTWSFSGTTTEAFSQTGGTMKGTGTFGGLTVTNGTLAPGNSIGTMTVNGNFTLGSGSIFEVEVNAAGQSDKVLVRSGGSVNLTGSVLRVMAQNGNYNPTTDYTIIDNDGADAVTGTFSSVTSNFAFLTPSVNYKAGDGNDVVLTMVRKTTGGGGNTGGGTTGSGGTSGSGGTTGGSPSGGGTSSGGTSGGGTSGGAPTYVSFCSVAQTRNQCNVAHALDAFPTSNPLFGSVLTQTVAGARQAFNALSGEVHATVAGTLVDDSRYVREAVLGRLMQAGHSGEALSASGPQMATYDSGAMMLGGADLYDGKSLVEVPASAPLAFWTRAFGAWGDFDRNGNAASAGRDLGGFVSGMDAQLFGTWRVGVATGASFSNVSVDDRYSGADVDSYHLGGYAGGMVGPLALRGGGMWTWNEIETSRAVLFPNFYERQKADYDAGTGQIFGEIAYPTQVASIGVEPFAGLAYVSVDSDGIRERGGPQASLRGSSFDQDVGYTTVGLRAAKTLSWGDTEITPHLSAAWLHAFDGVTPGASLAFATTGLGFEVTGVPLAQDSALLDAGVDFAISDKLSAGVSYSGQYADTVADNAVKGRLTWLFN